MKQEVINTKSRYIADFFNKDSALHYNEGLTIDDLESLLHYLIKENKVIVSITSFNQLLGNKHYLIVINL